MPALSKNQDSDKEAGNDGWSSIDNVFSNQEINKLVKKPMTGPIKIGFTAKEVREVMGIPDSIDEEKYIYYYRQSPIFFNESWKVQSWDNRYGNLYVLPAMVKIVPGFHISEVFKLKGFPFRISKIDYSYQLEYPEELIYVSENWNVEAIRDRQAIEYNPNRENMNLENFLAEFKKYLVENNNF
jgi:hypothetical protein